MNLLLTIFFCTVPLLCNAKPLSVQHDKAILQHAVEQANLIRATYHADCILRSRCEDNTEKKVITLLNRTAKNISNKWLLPQYERQILSDKIDIDGSDSFLCEYITNDAC